MDSKRRDRERDRDRDSKDTSRKSTSSKTSSKHHDYSRTKFDDHMEEIDYQERNHRSRSKSRDKSSHKSSTTQSHGKYTSNISSSNNNNFSRHSINSNYDSQKQEDTYESKWSLGTPSTTIMMKSIPTYLGETEIKVELAQLGVNYKDFRLVKSRDTGTSRGFAFIEFDSIEESIAWMNDNTGSFYLDNSKVHLVYSQPKWDTNENRFREKKIIDPQVTDWDCSKCGIKNFKRRDHCFKCHIPREESDKLKDGAGYEYVGSQAANTLLIRGLDALTTEETIEQTMKSLTQIASKSCYIIRDRLTNLSNGFGFIEFSGVNDATQVIKRISLDSKFFIDGKCLQVDYCNMSFVDAINHAKSAPSVSYSSIKRNYEPYYARHYENSSNSNVNQADAANSAAAVAQAAMKNMQKKIYADTAYAPPDVSTYTFDEASGYYFDPITSFYYDSKTQYHYNPLTLKWMYWDATSMSYVPVETQATSAVAITEAVESLPLTQTQKTIVEPVAKKAKLSTATEIAKNMEKWAEQQNKKKKQITITTPTTPCSPTQTKSTPAQHVLSILTPIVQVETQLVKKPIDMIPVTQQLTSNDLSSSSSSSSLLADGSMVKHEIIVKKEKPAVVEAATIVEEKEACENKFVDLIKLACLLCKRKFDSKELLNKHCQMSQLHKTNLEKLKSEEQQRQENESPKKKVENNQDSVQAALEYRDRAKERRKKFGIPSPPRDNNDPIVSNEEPEFILPNDTSYADSSNASFASKLMKKMGWNEGSGLGRNNQGISTPIEASVRQRGLGLGASGGSQFDPNDTYKEAVRKSAIARFRQLNS